MVMRAAASGMLAKNGMFAMGEMSAGTNAVPPLPSVAPPRNDPRARTRIVDRRGANVAESLLVDVLPVLHRRHGLAAAPAVVPISRPTALPATSRHVPAPGRSRAVSRVMEPGQQASPRAGAADRAEAADRVRSAGPTEARRGPASPAGAPAPHSSALHSPAFGAALIDAALRADAPSAWNRMIDDLAAAMGPADANARRELREAVIVPAVRRLGTAWCEDHASFVDVTIGTARLTEALDRLPGRARDGDGARVVLAPTPGDGHVLGLSLLAEALREGGFAVDVMGRASAAAVGRAAGRSDVLGIGVPVARHAGRAAMLVRAARTAAREAVMPLVVAGGGAAGECAALLRASGVDEVMGGASGGASGGGDDPARWLARLLEHRSAERVGGRVGEPA